MQGLHSGKYSLKFFILSQLIVHTSSSKLSDILNLLNSSLMTSDVYFKNNYSVLSVAESSLAASD
jgi:hypothetical protein